MVIHSILHYLDFFIFCFFGKLLGKMRKEKEKKLKYLLIIGWQQVVKCCMFVLPWFLREAMQWYQVSFDTSLWYLLMFKSWW
jgi:hypothetical protein